MAARSRALHLVGFSSSLFVLVLAAYATHVLSFVVNDGIRQSTVCFRGGHSSTARKTRYLNAPVPVVAEVANEQDQTVDEKATESNDIFIKQAFEASNDIPKSVSRDQKTDHPTPPQLEARPFPIGMIVNLEEIKHALILAAINPRVGGVIIYGGRGTGKSVLARAVHRLLPACIERVKGNPYNIDPHGTEGIDSFLQNEILDSGVPLEEMETEMIPTPFVQVPLNVMEDSLLGTVDLELSIQTGRTVFSPGLLAKAHRGILYVDEVNLLDEEAANILLNIIADGSVTVEREGLSVQYPCRPLVIATYNPEEGELREHLLDRVGVALPADARPLGIAERVRAVENVIGFSGGTKEQFDTQASEALERAEKEETELRDAILSAKSILPDVTIESSQILYLCQEATRAGCEGQRAEIFATEVAKTCAAFSGRTKVNAQDLQIAVILAIAPRGTLLPEEAPSDEEETSLPPAPPQMLLQPLPPPPDEITSEENEQEEVESENQEDETESEPEEEETPQEELEIPDQFMFGVDATPIDPKLLSFGRWTRKGKGGKRSKIFNLERGRFVKAIFPKGARKGKLAVGATLRAAAPYQKMRRQRAKGNKLVYIDKGDFRIKRMSRKAGSLVIFVVDASGSMALNRMDAAKGAALSLLSEAYKSRDKICLIAFHGGQAEVLVPPTKSMALTKNRLEGMPCGGGSPLAHALTLAMRTGLNAIKVKQDVGRVVIVLLTDGRANRPLCTSMGDEFEPDLMDPESKDGMPSRKFLKDEVIAIAKTLGSLKDFNLLCIDTEDRFVGTGVARELATAAMGNYHHVTFADSSAVAHITKKDLEAARMEDTSWTTSTQTT